MHIITEQLINLATQFIYVSALVIIVWLAFRD